MHTVMCLACVEPWAARHACGACSSSVGQLVPVPGPEAMACLRPRHQFTVSVDVIRGKVTAADAPFALLARALTPRRATTCTAAQNTTSATPRSRARRSTASATRRRTARTRTSRAPRSARTRQPPPPRPRLPPPSQRSRFSAATTAPRVRSSLGVVTPPCPTWAPAFVSYTRARARTHACMHARTRA